MTSDNKYRSYEEYGCSYDANVTGYVSVQLPTGMRKEVKYWATVYFNVENNEITDLTLDYVMFQD